MYGKGAGSTVVNTNPAASVIRAREGRGEGGRALGSGGFDSGRSFVAPRLNQLWEGDVAPRLNQLWEGDVAARLSQLWERGCRDPVQTAL